MKILIGLPIYKREWILPHWLRAIENQTIPLSEIGFLFELGPHDEATHDMLWEWHSRHPEVAVFDGIIREHEVHKHHAEGQRQWARHDYHRMVDFRNNLLERAVGYQPERYFSLDSDILIPNPRTLEGLFQITAEPGTTAAPLCYMTPRNIDAPNVMTWIDKPGGRARRLLDQYPIGTVFEVGISMAAVMMSPEVYNNVRYRWHFQGEDLGWSAEVLRLGYKMYSASNIYAPHIMQEGLLEFYLQNDDQRSTDLMSLQTCLPLV